MSLQPHVPRTSSQCPCRFVILATKKALNSHKHRDRHIYTSQIQDTSYIHTRYAHACGVCGLFSWRMAAGLLAFSSRQFALTIKHGPLSASHYFSFLSKRSGRRMPPAERSALYTYTVPGTILLVALVPRTRIYEYVASIYRVLCIVYLYHLSLLYVFL